MSSLENSPKLYVFKPIVNALNMMINKTEY